VGAGGTSHLPPRWCSRQPGLWPLAAAVPDSAQLAIMNAGEDDRPVAGSATGNLLVMDREFPCPRCGYAIWIQYAEIVAQAAVLCPCCRTRVLLRDAAGSVQLAGEVMQRAQERLARALKGLGR